MDLRRRLFQQNRSKSAIEIATDFLFQTRQASSQADLSIVTKVQENSDSSGALSDHSSPNMNTSQAEGGVKEDRHQPHQQQDHVERRSWRKVMFDRVCTTMVPGFSLLNSPGGDDCGTDSTNSRRRKKSEVRARWKKATLETLVSLRTKKEETGQEDKENSPENRLGYEDLSPCSEEVKQLWQDLLSAASSSSSSGSPLSMEYQTLLGHVKRGIPRELRGMVWRFLALHQSCQSWVESCPSDMYDVPYSQLINSFSADQHAILIDLGRTFPGHPLFVKPLGSGQVSLFNLLKAYSLMDTEVGYCQGVSFIAGVLLMHMEEEGAFEMIRHLMLGLGLRSLYCPSMAALQLRLYQLVRLLRDHDPELSRHLDSQEVVPALYATPWFLTMFASQYPLPFVARVMDLLFTQGPEVMFKVALKLMTCHRELILHYDCFEDLVDFLKTGLPEMARIQTERVTDLAVDLNISHQLHNYEIEFHVFRDDMLSATHPSPTPSPTTPNPHHNNNTTKINNNDTQECSLHRLQRTVVKLQDQKKDLSDQLSRAHGELCTLNMAANRFRLKEDEFKARIRALELERSALLSMVSSLQCEGSVESEQDNT